MAITISNGTIYTPKDLVKLARSLAASKERMAQWHIHIGTNGTVTLAVDFMGKDGWTTQRSMVL